jgi:SAM-dependent methyltransferase
MIAKLERPELLPLLCCPACGASLTPAAEPFLGCAGCHRRFPLTQGRPVLLADGAPEQAKQNVVIEAQAQQRQKAQRTGLRRAVDRFRQATTADIFADDRQQVPMLVERIEALTSERGWVLDVGACEQYYRASLERLGPVIALDISVYSATDVVADCHALPFAEGSLFAVSAIEVLEHLRRPWRFVEEVARVLRPGGLFFGVAPQYCPTHGFPHDFFRYTRSGLAALAEQAGLELSLAWPLGGQWGTLFHWYWANHARESRLRRVPVLNVGYHLWFQGAAWLLDRLDARGEHGARPLAQEHNDHVGWSFIARKPGPR